MILRLVRLLELRVKLGELVMRRLVARIELSGLQQDLQGLLKLSLCDVALPQLKIGLRQLGIGRHGNFE